MKKQSYRKQIFLGIYTKWISGIGELQASLTDDTTTTKRTTINIK